MPGLNCTYLHQQLLLLLIKYYYQFSTMATSSSYQISTGIRDPHLTWAVTDNDDFIGSAGRGKQPDSLFFFNIQKKNPNVFIKTDKHTISFVASCKINDLAGEFYSSCNMTASSGALIRNDVRPWPQFSFRCLTFSRRAAGSWFITINNNLI